MFCVVDCFLVWWLILGFDLFVVLWFHGVLILVCLGFIAFVFCAFTFVICGCGFGL